MNPIVIKSITALKNSKQLFKAHYAGLSNFRSSEKSSFDYQDALSLETLLTEDERKLRDEVRDYCQHRLMPRVLKDDQTATFDVKLVRDFGQLGVLGSAIKGYGCLGVSSVATGLIMREIERVDSG